MSTLERIIEKRQNNEIKAVNEVVYHSEHLGEDIIIKKKPLSVYLDIVKEAEGENEVTLMNYMLHAYLPMFQNPDGVKATMEYYQSQGVTIATPRELPEFVFDSNIKEMGEIVELIGEFYDFENVDSDIKN